MLSCLKYDDFIYINIYPSFYYKAFTLLLMMYIGNIMPVQCTSNEKNIYFLYLQDIL